MIGTLDYIIDIVAEKHKVDRRIVEVIAQENFKRLKTRLVNSTAVAINMNLLGTWVCSNRKLRNYVRQYIKKLRKIRQAISKEKNEEKLTALKNREVIYVERVRTAWSQMEAIRAVYISLAEKKKKRIERAIQKYGIYEPSKFKRKIANAPKGE